MGEGLRSLSAGIWGLPVGAVSAGLCGIGPGVTNKVTTSSLPVPLDECFHLFGVKAEQRRPRSRAEAEVQGGCTRASQKLQTLPQKTAPLFTSTKAGGCLVPRMPWILGDPWVTPGATVCGFNCSRRCEMAFHRGLSLRFLSDK